MHNKRNYEYLLSDLSTLKGVGAKTSNLLKRKKLFTDPIIAVQKKWINF